MHTDLSRHLHTDKCNALIDLLYACRQEHPYTKYFGKCNLEDARMLKCLKEERIARRARNIEKSNEWKARMKRIDHPT